ncbi:hypothetical protein G5I_04117 [Acromyrmex echinatior]|uniref:Uncharacterized protein n=1 Tax=Acromyrmex echinatior TaxID=103372 RepID=F4WES5_ACREC|nr:hypothetical protein G5I_04117 [Acromyrmex echinatior]
MKQLTDIALISVLPLCSESECSVERKSFLCQDALRRPVHAAVQLSMFISERSPDWIAVYFHSSNSCSSVLALLSFIAFATPAVPLTNKPKTPNSDRSRCQFVNYTTFLFECNMDNSKELKDRERIAKQIAKASDLIRKKYRALKTDKIDEDIALEKHFNSIDEPLKQSIKNSANDES